MGLFNWAFNVSYRMINMIKRMIYFLCPNMNINPFQFTKFSQVQCGSFTWNVFYSILIQRNTKSKEKVPHPNVVSSASQFS